jgi:hypothetical protein
MLTTENEKNMSNEVRKDPEKGYYDLVKSLNI